MKSVVVQAITKDFRVHVRTARARMFQFLDDERSATFTHDKSIARRMEWTTSQSRIGCPSAHRFRPPDPADSRGNNRYARLVTRALRIPLRIARTDPAVSAGGAKNVLPRSNREFRPRTVHGICSGRNS